MKMRPGKDFFVVCALALSLAVAVVPAAATPLEQWASTVINFSSQYSPSDWAASQALGLRTPLHMGILVRLGPPARGRQPGIYHPGVRHPGLCHRGRYPGNLGNGFVYQVDVLDLNDVLHNVWTGTDPSLPGTPVDFAVSWPKTAYLVKGLKIYINTDHLLMIGKRPML